MGRPSAQSLCDLTKVAQANSDSLLEIAFSLLILREEPERDADCKEGQTGHTPGQYSEQGFECLQAPNQPLWCVDLRRRCKAKSSSAPAISVAMEGSLVKQGKNFTT
jgi:hypothetical protein